MGVRFPPPAQEKRGAGLKTGSTVSKQSRAAGLIKRIKRTIMATITQQEAAPLHKHLQVTVTEDMVNEEVERLRTRYGNMAEPETVSSEDNVLNVQFTETDASGNHLPGGIQKDNSLLVKYFREGFRSRLMGLKSGDSF